MTFAMFQIHFAMWLNNISTMVTHNISTMVTRDIFKLIMNYLHLNYNEPNSKRMKLKIAGQRGRTMYVLVVAKGKEQEKQEEKFLV